MIPWNKGLKIQLNTGRTHFQKGVISPYGFKKGMTPKNKGNTNEISTECEVCFKRFKYRKCSKTGRFCSVKCSYVMRTGPLNHKWIGGSWLTVRKMILKEQDYTCQSCGLRDMEIMEVNHKLQRCDYPELSRNKDNLEVLCPNCHRRKTNLSLKDRASNK